MPSPTPALSRLRSAALAIAMSALVGACAEPPDERVLGAWDAASLEDEDRFLGYFTTQSANLLRGVAITKRRTRGDLAYLRDIYEALPSGEVVEVKERGNMALVTVKAKRKRFDIRLLHERGEWHIDALALPHFWQPLADAKED